MRSEEHAGGQARSGSGTPATAKGVVRKTKSEALADTPRPIPVKGLSRLATFIRGKEILILGPGNAGKTKFAQYLQRAALDPEGKREMTYAVTRSPAFVVDFGQKDGLVLRVRRAVDTPGQVGPLQHAILIARRKPHAVIVILDCSSDPLATLRWFCLFCNALDSVLRKVAPVARRLQEMVVLLNKRDKIEDKEFAKLHQAVRKAMERFLTVAWGEERVRSIPIQECILVQTGRGTTLVDGVIARLTERLLKRQDPPAAVTGPDPALGSSGDLPFDPLRPSGRPTSTPSGPARPAAGAGSKPTAGSPASRRPYSSRLSQKPTPTPSSGPAGRQDQQTGASGSKPGVVPLRPSSSRPSDKPAPAPSSPPSPPAATPDPNPAAASPAGVRRYLFHPSDKPAPAPSSGPAGRQDQQTAGADPKPAAPSPAGVLRYLFRPSDKPAPTPSSEPGDPAAATPTTTGPNAGASGLKEESKSDAGASGPQEEPKSSDAAPPSEIREVKTGGSDMPDAPSNDKPDAPKDKEQPASRSTFRSRWPQNP